MKKEEVLATVAKRGIRFIRLLFCDIVGFPKCVTITSDELEDSLDNGKGFDGSSIEGFTRIYESDMIAMPDPSTFKVLPWNDGGEEALLFCDVLEPDGTPYAGDPRSTLKRVLGLVEKRGWTFNIGPELEYFYFTNDENPRPLDSAGYFDLTPPDLGEALRKKTIIALDSLGIHVECSHHEVAPSQHEIDLKYCDALAAADNVMLSKLVIKEIALQAGVHATFMPKPIYGENGSGMHLHQSLIADGRNVFYNPDDKSHLSDTAKSYAEGLLQHAREITLLTDQWVNSYKRLVPGYEAPVYISWARMNRSTLIRVPRYRPGHEMSTRIELRCPDPACNPYLVFAVMLAAGLKGIDEKLTLRDHVEENIFAMTAEEREERGIKVLPGNLSEAIAVARKSTLLRETLGEETFEKLLRNK
ncbi:MAG: type I glutamate--ammonia ligase, partial [Candidatus Eisenbacteria sp.]|nr:type I glutamate--ammonia ligase [Candidatus Eisenbacteria bacterium]